jgi:hypothetical protein
LVIVVSTVLGKLYKYNFDYSEKLKVQTGGVCIYNIYTSSYILIMI